MRLDITRRDFLKLSGGTAAMLGLSQSWVPKIALALEQAAQRPPVVWMSFMECTGCLESFAKSVNPSTADIVLDIISLNYQENIMAAAGTQAEADLKNTLDKGGYIAIIEGAIAVGIPEAMMVAGKTSLDLVKEVTQNAAATLCVGTCAAYGGVQAMKPNPTGAKGVKDAIGIETVNVPGCPPNPAHILPTIVHYLLFNKLPDLDSDGRPLFLFEQKIHDNCERRAHFDAGRYVGEFGTPEETLQYCLYKMGCKGPETHSPCPKTLWNAKQSWCVKCGNGCIGCMEPDFWDRFEDFYQRLPNVPIPGFVGVKTSADWVGSTLVTATMAGIGIHAIASAATGRYKKHPDIPVKEVPKSKGPSEGSED